MFEHDLGFHGSHRNVDKRGRACPVDHVQHLNKAADILRSLGARHSRKAFTAHEQEDYISRLDMALAALVACGAERDDGDDQSDKAVAAAAFRRVRNSPRLPLGQRYASTTPRTPTGDARDVLNRCMNTPNFVSRGR